MTIPPFLMDQPRDHILTHAGFPGNQHYGGLVFQSGNLMYGMTNGLDSLGFANQRDRPILLLAFFNLRPHFNFPSLLPPGSAMPRFPDPVCGIVESWTKLPPFGNIIHLKHIVYRNSTKATNNAFFDPILPRVSEIVGSDSIRVPGRTLSPPKKAGHPAFFFIIKLVAVKNKRVMKEKQEKTHAAKRQTVDHLGSEDRQDQTKNRNRLDQRPGNN